MVVAVPIEKRIQKKIRDTKSTVMRWKDTFRLKRRLDAQAVGAELIEINAREPITARAVVERARAETSAMHGAFTWDVKRAAQKCWEEEARYILQHIIIVQVEGVPVEGEPRGLIYEPPNNAVKGNPPGGQYVWTAEAVRDEDTCNLLLARALAELQAFKHKYEHLVELVEVIAAIDGVLKKKPPRRPQRGPRGGRR